MREYIVIFVIENKTEKIIEEHIINASSQEEAHRIVFKTKILNKYKNKDYTFYVLCTEILK